jgi:hypothetical protein
MKVIIEQRHTIGTTYRDCEDCALARAIREQHPEFPLRGVGGETIHDKNYNNYPIEFGWHGGSFIRLQKGEIPHFILDIPVPWYDEKYYYPDLTKSLAVLPDDKIEVDVKVKELV